MPQWQRNKLRSPDLSPPPCWPPAPPPAPPCPGGPPAPRLAAPQEVAEASDVANPPPGLATKLMLDLEPGHLDTVAPGRASNEG